MRYLTKDWEAPQLYSLQTFPLGRVFIAALRLHCSSIASPELAITNGEHWGVYIAVLRLRCSRIASPELAITNGEHLGCLYCCVLHR